MASLEWLETMPEFSHISDATKTAYINQADQCLDTTYFCADSEYVLALAAAHSMSMVASRYRSKGASGPVTTIREGDLTLSFGTGASYQYAASDYGQTPYGQRLKSLMNTGGAGVSMGLV